MKFSIITPSYNQGKFIKKTLLSVSKQKKKNFQIEHIVIDGKSSDSTIKILKTFKPAVKWISESDKGQTNALNKGILASSGDIIGWLNSDDIYYEDAIESVANIFKKNSNIQIIYGMADHIDKKDKPFETYLTIPFNYEILKDRCFICQPAVFFRRSLIDRYGLFDESLNFCMDYEFWLRLGQNDVKFNYLKKKLAGSRLYKETKTCSSQLKIMIEIVRMQKKKFNIVSDTWVSSYAHNVPRSLNLNQEKNPFMFFFIFLFSYYYCSVMYNGNIPIKTIKNHFEYFLTTFRKILKKLKN
jgi:glycosyltransferase involved in cell wall biosynthesis